MGSLAVAGVCIRQWVIIGCKCTHTRPKHLLGVRHGALPFEEEGIYEEHPDRPNTGQGFCEKNNFPNSSKEGLAQVDA